MAVTREQLQEDLPWDAERIPVGVGEHASDCALEVLNEIEDEYKSARRVAAYARRDDEDKRVATKHLLRTVQQADGRLALVTWDSGGITAVGYRPDDQRFDVGGYSAMDDLMGNDRAEYYELTTRAKAKDILAWKKPDVVCRSDADLLPDLNELEVTA